MPSSRGAIGILEYQSVPKGMYVLHEIKKKIQFTDIQSEILPGGKFIIYMKGSHGNVEYGMELGFSEDTLVDLGWLGSVNKRLEIYLEGYYEGEEVPENLFIFQHKSYAKTLELTNTLLNTLDLEIVHLRAERNMEGASLAIFSGGVSDVLGAKALMKEGEVLTNIDEDVYAQIRGYYEDDSYFSRR